MQLQLQGSRATGGMVHSTHKQSTSKNNRPEVSKGNDESEVLRMRCISILQKLRVRYTS